MNQPELYEILHLTLPDKNIEINSYNIIKNNLSRIVIDSQIKESEDVKDVIITIFKDGELSKVNTNLSHKSVANKCVLSFQEFPKYDVPTPKLLGSYSNSFFSSIATEKIMTTKFNDDSRILAAKKLAKIHDIDIKDLSIKLQELINISDPNENRTTKGCAPKSNVTTLVHGDFFSKNILFENPEIYIIDWETLGMGDPMWDLAFLIGADNIQNKNIISKVIEAYSGSRLVNEKVLRWHIDHWNAFWQNKK